MAGRASSVREPPFQIVSSVREPTYQYYVNRAYLEQGLADDHLRFDGGVFNHSPSTFEFRTQRIYDFTRSAKAKVRDDMAYALHNWLRELPVERCLEAFDWLFDHHYYKEYLTDVGLQKRESMKLLISVNLNQRKRYVAHVQFSCVSKRNETSIYTVNATLTCQRYTYFKLREADLDEVIKALQNLQVNE